MPPADALKRGKKGEDRGKKGGKKEEASEH